MAGSPEAGVISGNTCSRWKHSCHCIGISEYSMERNRFPTFSFQVEQRFSENSGESSVYNAGDYTESLPAQPEQRLWHAGQDVHDRAPAPAQDLEGAPWARYQASHGRHARNSPPPSERDRIMCRGRPRSRLVHPDHGSSHRYSTANLRTMKQR